MQDDDATDESSCCPDSESNDENHRVSQIENFETPACVPDDAIADIKWQLATGAEGMLRYESDFALAW